MISVGGIAATGSAASRRHAAPQRPEDAQGGGKALICVSPVEPAERPSAYNSRRPAAAFLAHLIAMREHAPQTRERRRAEPEEATAAYRMAAARMPMADQKIIRSS